MIELIVVVGFIVLFAAFSTAYYNSYTEEKKLENASKRLVSVLELTKSKTISADASYCGGTNAQVQYYSFLTSSTENKYTVLPNCRIGTPTPVAYELERNVTFLYPTPTITFTIDFQPVFGSVANCSFIYLKNQYVNNGQGACRYVKVSKTGLISEDACTTCANCSTTCP